MNDSPAPYAGEHRTPNKSDADIIDDETAAAFEVLQQRAGRMRTVEPRFNQMQEDIKAAISDIVPGLEWTTTRSRGESPCSAPFSNTTGYDVTLTPYSSDTPIPPELWPRVAESVNMIATANGFDSVDLGRPTGGSPTINLTDPDGGSILLGSGGRTALMITTGCYLEF